MNIDTLHNAIAKLHRATSPDARPYVAALVASPDDDLSVLRAKLIVMFDGNRVRAVHESLVLMAECATLAGDAARQEYERHRAVIEQVGQTREAAEGMATFHTLKAMLAPSSPSATIH